VKRFRRDTPSGEAVEVAGAVRDALGGGATPNDTPVYSMLEKSGDELRYTLGPVYSPGVLDAHGETTDSEELRKALWDYSVNGDRQLRKQHGRERIGQIVELFQWPHEHEAELKLPGSGELRKVKFPAGTVYAGVVWTEEAWPLVKSGEITGYSMGGTTFRTRDAVDDGDLVKFT